jgi:hypothetical protein
MSKPTITTFNLETGEEVTRPMTADEIAQYQIDTTKMTDEIAAENEAAAAKAALLTRLGITAEEAALLLK